MSTLTGLQIYSLREKCSENFENVLKQVSGAGYEGVEFYSFFDIKADKMKQLLNSYGLKPMGTHTNLGILQNSLDSFIDYCSTLEMEFVGLAKHDAPDRDEWLRFCEEFDKIGEKMRNNGITLMYHNHAHELQPNFNGETAEDIIIRNTSPKNVSLELDCFWVKSAGIDPEEYLKSNIDRVKTIHLKDMDNEKKMTEVGTGIINCPGLYKICKDAGMKWVVVEQDKIYIDPFESIKISLNNIRKWC